MHVKLGKTTHTGIHTLLKALEKKIKSKKTKDQIDALSLLSINTLNTRACLHAMTGEGSMTQESMLLIFLIVERCGGTVVWDVEKQNETGGEDNANSVKD
jgi:multisubunit Na+/H+ antiporter MnhF subunit